MAEGELSLLVNLKNNTGQGLRSLKSDMAGIEQQTGKTSGGLSKFTSALGGIGKAAAVAGAGLGVAGLAGGFAVAVKSAANFEQSLADVKAATGASADAMKLMRAEALKIGADTSKSAGEAVAAMGELTKSGVSVADAVGGVARTVVQLSESTGASVADMATLMADSLNVFQIGADKSSDAANILAKAAGASSIDISDLAQSLAAGGLVAAQAGLSIDDFATAIGIMGNQGLKASDAGTSLKSFIAALTPNSKEAAKAMSDLGFSAFDAAGKFKPMGTLVGDLEKAFKTLTPEQRATNAELIFGADGVRALNALLTDGAPGWANFTAEMGKAPSIAEQSAARLDTLKGRVETLKGTLETMAINVGSVVLPALTTLATKGSEQLDKLMKHDWSGWKTNFKTAAEDTRDAVLPVLTGIFGTFKGEADETIKWFEREWPTIEKASDNVAGAVKKVWTTIFGEIRTANKGEIEGLGNDIITGFVKMEDQSTSSSEKIRGHWAAAFDHVGKSGRAQLSVVIDLLALDFPKAAGDMKVALIEAWKANEAGARASWEITKNLGGDLKDLGGWLAGQGKNALEAWGNLWFRAADGVRRLIDSIPSVEEAWNRLRNLQIPGWMEKILPGSDPPIVTGIKQTKKELKDLGDEAEKLDQKLTPALLGLSALGVGMSSITALAAAGGGNAGVFGMGGSPGALAAALGGGPGGLSGVGGLASLPGFQSGPGGLAGVSGIAGLPGLFGSGPQGIGGSIGGNTATLLETAAAAGTATDALSGFNSALAEMQAAAAWFASNGFGGAFGSDTAATAARAASGDAGTPTYHAWNDFIGAVSSSANMFGAGVVQQPDAQRLYGMSSFGQEEIRAIRARALAAILGALGLRPGGGAGGGAEIRMAGGGLITEPIMGMGLRTGTSYSFGEKGPERVTPGTGGGNTYIVNINAGSVVKEKDLVRTVYDGLVKFSKDNPHLKGLR
jgi:TP901 family phage tail tape measure protein